MNKNLLPDFLITIGVWGAHGLSPSKAVCCLTMIKKEEWDGNRKSSNTWPARDSDQSRHSVMSTSMRWEQVTGMELPARLASQENVPLEVQGQLSPHCKAGRLHQDAPESQYTRVRLPTGFLI